MSTDDMPIQPSFMPGCHRDCRCCDGDFKSCESGCAVIAEVCSLLPPQLNHERQAATTL
jgi:hypothetical protein